MSFGGYSSNGGFDNGSNAKNRLKRTFGTFKGKTVFPTDQTIHVWAQQKQPYGRNAKASVFFETDTIYSYGHHFPMARFVKPGVVLLNEDKHSVTTSGHQSTVRAAIRQHKRYSVADCLASTPEAHDANIAAMIKQCAGLVATIRNKRASQRNREYARGSLESTIALATEYQTEFFPKRKRAPFVIPSDIAALEIEIRKDGARREVMAALSAYKRANSTRDMARAIRQIVRTAVKAKRLDVPMTQFKLWTPARYLKLWRAAKRGEARARLVPHYHYHQYAAHAVVTAQGQWNSDQQGVLCPANSHRPRGFAVFDKFARDMKTTAQLAADVAAHEAWQAQWKAEREAERKAAAATMAEVIQAFRETGIHVSKLRNVDCMLFLKGDTIKTSWGAEFPADHGARAWKILKRVKGTEHKFTGIRLGHFTVDKIATDGTITAGCHVVPFVEAERIAVQLGLDT